MLGDMINILKVDMCRGEILGLLWMVNEVIHI